MPEFARTLGEAFRTYARTRREGKEKEREDALAIYQLSQQAAAQQSQALLSQAQQALSKFNLESARIRREQEAEMFPLEKEYKKAQATKLLAGAEVKPVVSYGDAEKMFAASYGRPYGGTPVDKYNMVKMFANKGVPLNQVEGGEFFSYDPEEVITAIREAGGEPAEVVAPETGMLRTDVIGEPAEGVPIYGPEGFVPEAGAFPQAPSEQEQLDYLDSFLALPAKQKYEQLTSKAWALRNAEDITDFNRNISKLEDEAKRLRGQIEKFEITAEERRYTEKLAKERIRQESLKAETNTFLNAAIAGKLSRGYIRLNGKALSIKWKKVFGEDRDFKSEALSAVTENEARRKRGLEYRVVSRDIYKLYVKALKVKGEKTWRGKLVKIPISEEEALLLNKASGEIKRYTSRSKVTADEIKKVMDSYKLFVFPDSVGKWLEGKAAVEPTAKFAEPKVPTVAPQPAVKPKVQISQKEWKTPAGKKRIVQQLGLVEAQISALDEAFGVK